MELGNQGQKAKKRWPIILVLALLSLGGAFYFIKAEGTPPQVQISPDKDYLGRQDRLQIQLSDPESGLEEVKIEALQDGQRLSLLPATEIQGLDWERALSLKDSGLEEGEFSLEVTATDNSWSGLGKGNRVQAKRTYILDRTRPVVGITTTAHNLNQGGSGLVAFTADEALSKAGVVIKDEFFPAYQPQGRDWVCLFSFPYFVLPGEESPLLVAEDRAGNRFQTGFRYHVNPAGFNRDQINISDAFLQAKMPQYEDRYPKAKGLLEVFLEVNGPLREEDRDQLRQLGKRSVASRLWEGRFLRLPNSARMASFGDQRTYTYKGQAVDQAVHLGVDLASVARAPVPAANSGQVVLAEFLGIYGQVVIIDHGLGLQTLYAHLSEIGVDLGQGVDKGEIIGRTGATGLAGGDHLHFAVLISGRPVNPVEWWDQAWIENNILSKWQGLK